MDALLRALTDPYMDVRQNAAFGLGNSRDPRARAPLTALLDDPDATVRRLAGNALAKLKKA